MKFCGQRRYDREHARSLRALAYRMLGSRAEAEDVVQEAWLRWAHVDEGRLSLRLGIFSPQAPQIGYMRKKDPG